MVGDVSTSESSLDRSSVTHFKVEVPGERMVRLRKAEPGMVLSREVTNDNGQLLFPKGKTLDHGAIEKLRRFKKRAIYVKDRRTKWVDEEEFQQLPDSAEWLDTREVPAPETEESSGEDSEEGVFQELFEFVDETDSPKYLKEFVGVLEEELTIEDEQGHLQEQLEALRDQTTDVSDLIQYLLAQVSKIDDQSVREQILESLGKMDEHREQLLENSSVSDEMIFDLEQIREEKHQVKNQLHDFVHDQAENLESMDAERIPESSLPDSASASETNLDQQGLEEVLDEDVLEDLIRLIREASEEQADRLFSVLEDLLGEQNPDLSDVEERFNLDGGEESNEKVPHDDLNPEELERIQELLAASKREERSVEDCLLDAFDAMDSGRWGEAVHEFNGCLEESLPEGAPVRFEQYEDQSAQLLNHKKQLTDRINETMNPPEEYDSFEELLNAPEAKLFEEMSNQKVPSDVSESVRSFLNERQDLVFSFWNDLRDILPDILESVEEGGRAEVLEKFRNITDELLLNHLKEPMEDNLYDDNVPSGEVPSHRDELLDQAIEARDFEKIKRFSSLPDSVIEQYENHYRAPKDLNKWQRKLLDLHSTVLEQLLLALRVPHDAVNRYVHEFSQIYESESKLFSLFLQPPDPDDYHLVHTFNTTLLSLMVGEEVGLPEKAQETLLLAGSLADVGLVVIPDSFYLIDDELSRRARNEVRKHPVYSRKISSHIFGPQHSVPRLVAEHHERSDGGGYPHGKIQEDLSPLSGILGSADSYTAMIEDRTYRSSKLPDEALSVLRDETSGLNEKPVESITRILGFYPNGSLVKLSDDTLAFVSRQTDDPRNPQVFVLTDADRNRLDNPVKKDLPETNLEVNLLLRT
jgi:HD-GYP domain-containing protein (c-di-GMP phosphodiesterase class II)